MRKAMKFLIKHKFVLDADQYHNIKRKFTKLRTKHKLVLVKDVSPYMFKWIGNNEILIAKYDMIFNVDTRERELLTAFVIWKGYRKSQLLKDLKRIMPEEEE